MKKAKQLVAKATKTFDVAIADVEKANGMLVAEMAAIGRKVGEYEEEILKLKSQIDEANKERDEYMAEVQANDLLIEKLAQFSTGGAN